jgi:hypothetical protein
MSDKIVELDKHLTMTPEQVFARAQRDGFKDVMVIGYDKNEILTVVVSDMTTAEAYWMLQRVSLDLLMSGED